jgi:hypothetical protein
MLCRAGKKYFVLLTQPFPDTNGFFSFPCQSEYFNLSGKTWTPSNVVSKRYFACSERTMHQSTITKRRDKVSFSEEAWAYLGRRIDGISGVTSTGNDSENGPAMRAIAKQRKLKCSSMMPYSENLLVLWVFVRNAPWLLDKQERRVVGVNDMLL